MLKTVAVLALTLTLLSPWRAAAADGRGEIVFTDALYGAAVGGLVGAGAWLIDQNDAGVKIGTGLVVGTVGGLIFGVADAQSLVRVEDGELKFALPTPQIRPQDRHLTYAVNLLHVPFR